MDIRSQIESQRKLVEDLFDLAINDCPNISQSKHYTKLLEESQKLDELLLKYDIRPYEIGKND